MAKHLQLDDQDRRALTALDEDFAVSSDGEVAKLTGPMEVEIVRLADDGGVRLLLTLTFPNGKTFDVRLSRAQLLQELGIKDDEGTPS